LPTSVSVATGCPNRREGLVSEDAEFLAACADATHPLDVICPNRYAEPLAPNLAADRARQPVDWDAVARSLAAISADSDVLIVEGAGGIMVPIDNKATMLDLARALALPAVVVARPGLGTINHTVLTIDALRNAGVAVAGVVVNRYPADGAGVAEEANPRQIERWAKVPVLSIVPDEPVTGATLPPGVVAAVGQVDWDALARAGRGGR
jgi:dethiobiotin synthetase